MDDNDAIRAAAAAVRDADFLLVATGAGASRDSGLPTFQESPGYIDLCNPRCLLDCDGGTADKRELFYGFWSSALHRYATTPPHAGYALLAKWAASKDAFAVTSNVDGALQKSAFPGFVAPIHGEVNGHDWQCASAKCKSAPFALPEGFDFRCTADGTRALAHPVCPECGLPARPRVMMFEDTNFIGLPDAIEAAYPAYCTRVKRALRANPRARLCIVEVGCGDRVPTIHLLASFFNDASLWSDARDESSARVTLVRINPDRQMAGIVRQSAKHLQPYVVSIARKTLEAFQLIDAAM